VNEYTSYQDLDEYQSLDVSDTDDIELLRLLCEIASRMFDGTCRRTFYPRSETRYYDHPENTARLKVDDDLLEVTTFTTNNGDDSVSASDYYLMCGDSYNLTPYDRIVMKLDGGQPNLLYSGTPQKANAVTGMWGYHEDWDAAWQDSNDTVQDDGGIDASVTTITVSDADGADIYGITPRFKVQRLLKIDDEYVYVTAVNTSTDKLTVIRGVNGTTAAVHDNGATIYVYQPMVEVAHAVKRLAAWLYGQRDAPFVKQIVSVPGSGTTITIPEGAPLDVRAVAARYVRS
jgi:hypothetical protein